MHGYGSEDLEIDIRLRNAGLRRCQIKFAALALHLEHASVAPPDPSDPALPNNQLLYASRDGKIVRTAHGLEPHLADFREPPPDLRAGTERAG
jgi:hypothetical protein